MNFWWRRIKIWWEESTGETLHGGGDQIFGLWRGLPAIPQWGKPCTNAFYHKDSMRRKATCELISTESLKQQKRQSPFFAYFT